jgi:ATP-dependent RNA helicase DDX24/MAK5
MIFSATLTVQTDTEKEKKQRQQQRANKGQPHRRQRNGAESAANSLATIFEIIGLRPGHAVVDLSRNNGLALAEKLVETRVTCPTDDKDMYLWYFLLKYPGKAIVRWWLFYFKAMAVKILTTTTFRRCL